MVVLKNILVATDFGAPSAVALAYGRDLARAYSSTLHVLHIVDDPARRYSAEVGFVSADLARDFEARARKELDLLLTPDDRRKVNVLPVVQTCLSVAAGITGYAKDNAIDLIITGTHGRGAITHLLMGSVAERVVRTAPCPVLTVRAHEREFIAPEATSSAATATAATATT